MSFFNSNKYILYVFQAIKVKQFNLTKNNLDARNNERFAKIRNPVNVKLPTLNCKPQLTVCGFPA